MPERSMQRNISAWLGTEVWRQPGFSQIPNYSSVNTDFSLTLRTQGSLVFNFCWINESATAGARFLRGHE
jgi:hypothetical protein